MQQIPAAHQAPVPVPPAPRAEGAVVPIEELLVLRDRYPNIMIMGPDSAIDAALGELSALLRQPIASVNVEGLVELPLTLTQGTLILRNIGALNTGEQHRLHEWLGRTCGATQVIVTTTLSVLPSVERGCFLDVLYYRLNTVYLEVREL